MMARLQGSFALVAACLLVGCTSSTAELPVRTTFEPSTPFHTWKTFRLASKSGLKVAYPRYQQMVRDALVDELADRGYERIEDGAADFRVDFELGFRGDSAVQMTPEMGTTEPSERTLHGSNPSGSLTVSMLDPATGKKLWQGTVSEFTINAIEPQKGIRKAVWRVLVEFPPITG
jgi:hypothetical protein